MRKYKFYLENGETFEIEAGTVSFDDIDLAQTNAEKSLHTRAILYTKVYRM